GTFKSDRSTLGAGCTLGVGALVHYGVTLGDGATLAADSFLMKGEDVPPHALWAGNPATAVRDHRPRRSPADTPTDPPGSVAGPAPSPRSPHHGTTVAEPTPG
ncbi:peptide synthetase, partial [Streptomyces diastatochromogenes]